MENKAKFPIRVKILITVLVVVTVVVGLITFNMARMFHSDKMGYIHDLTSVIAIHAAEETRSLLIGYRERLQVFARLIYGEDLSSQQKAKMLRELFEDFKDFVAVSVYERNEEQVTVYNAKALKGAELTKGNLERYRRDHPLLFEKIESGEIFVENSTLSEKLPSMTMAFALTGTGKRRSPVISAVIRLDTLLRIAKRSKVFETFIVDGQGVLLAYSDGKRVAQMIRPDWFPEVKILEEKQALSTTIEYTEGGLDMVGAFTRVGFGDLVVGTKIPKTAAYLTARSLLNELFGIALVLLAIAALLSLLWARRMTRPIEKLSDAAGDVGKGRFDVQIDISSRDEIGMLAGSFKRMTTELKTREEALEHAQSQLVQSEKMAAFGQLGAGIAHEVKNPLAGILGYTQLSIRKMNKEDVLYKNLQVIEKETKRCRTIIDNLLKFARQEKVSFEPVEINRVVDDAVAIVDHQLGMHQIKLERDCAPGLPRVMGNGNQIQQVLMNIMINAQQAMDGKPGSVKISTRGIEGERIEIRVDDTGPGISEEIRSKLFEPFFTTKSAGKGTGLGLSVSYGIIKDHGGDITVESEAGKGSTFVITLPVIGSEGAPPAHYGGTEFSDSLAEEGDS
ncbi:MAG: HAMP domain-containing protein [Deltaproteobacteria bacterium]|nr:HAMP domain-containing protein [Deltaproteobacteria bacterium]